MYFSVNSSMKAFNKKYIIFDGIDTISKIYLNKNLIGSTNNMFVKYTFSVEEYLEVPIILKNKINPYTFRIIINF